MKKGPKGKKGKETAQRENPERVRREDPDS